MELEIININNSVNKVYLAQSTFIDEISSFKENYANLLKSIKQNDNEETLKDYINIFFRDTYYKNKFTIKENINNIDLVIYNGKEENDNIGVIVETKAIKSTEMITTKELNKKAFQELIQYYLEERVTNDNLEIKHLIITNSIDWFIFNASEFERLFYQNKSFLKKYNDWTNQQLVSKNKDWFYSVIAKPFIQESQEKISCTHFQLSKNIIENENTIIELYKIFSPEHLLKLPFQNDSNTLNREFYNELLHIIGLYETKDNTRKIERLKIQDRNEGSLLENVISIIETDDIFQNLEQPERFGETQEEQIFSIGLELCITWLNRILFLKLLESQLIKYNSKNFDFAFLNNQKIKDFEELKIIFFEILAVTPEDRKKTLQSKYEKVPYLNSSLFELTALEKETVKVNHLKHNTTLPIYNLTVLKDNLGKRKNGDLPVLQYIFEFLDSYNFASDNKLEIQEHYKTVINSSVLGLFFEKINGYKEGSFFTPGFITMYICRDTIRKTVIQKFNTVYNWNCTNLKPQLYNKISEIDIEKANEIFNSIRICDPAVGSGHFLVSALNELIAIKSELGILIDSEGQILRNTYCEVQNDELFINHFGQFFNYNFKDKESQRIQETIFKEKRILIENCLFGVDINPKSVQICRLRLWIELLKNSFYTKESNFTNLETLPNIDINIKTGNSLVSHFTLNGNGLTNGQSQKLKQFTQKYKEKVEQYKNSQTKQEKQVVEKFIVECKEYFSRVVKPNDDDFKKIKELEAEIGSTPLFFNKDEQTQWSMKLTRLNKERVELEKRYEEKRKEIYFNSFEWRFEFPEVLDDNGYFIGFDAIIGNPPYIQLSKTENLSDIYKKYLLEKFKTSAGRLNTFIFFIHNSFNLLKKDGMLGFIIPNTLLSQEYYQFTRQFILEKSEIQQIITYPFLPFETAVVENISIIIKNRILENYNIQIFEQTEINTLPISEKSKQNFILQPNFNFALNDNLLIDKIFTNEFQKLSELCNINQAIALKGDKSLSLKDNNPEGKYYKLLDGRNIQKYSINWDNVFLDYDVNKIHSCKTKDIFLAKEKLFFRRVSANLIFTYDSEQYFALNTLVVVTSKNNVTLNIKYLLAIMNSKLMNYIYVNKFKSTKTVFSEIQARSVGELPICIPKEKNSIKKIEKLVNEILDKKLNKTETINLENEIDKIVYKIYGIVDSEIEVIEKQNK